MVKIRSLWPIAKGRIARWDFHTERGTLGKNQWWENRHADTKVVGLMKLRRRDQLVADIEL